MARATLLICSVALVMSPFVQPGAGLAQTAIADPRTLVLQPQDLVGYELDPAQSADDDRPDGGLISIAVYRRTTAVVGPLVIRSTINSFGTSDQARVLYQRLPGILAREDFTPTAAPALGDESAGFTSPDYLDGQPVLYQTVLFREASTVGLTTVVGPTSTTTIDQAAMLTNQIVARIVTAMSLPVTSSEPGIQSTTQTDPFGGSPPIVADSPPPRTSATPSPTPSPSRSSSSQSTGNTPAGPPGILLSATLIDGPDVGSGLHLGGFSGLVAVDQSGLRYVTVTDRGPNDELGSGKSRKMTFPQPDFSPSIIKLEVRGDRLQITDRIPLKLQKGFTDPLTGNANVSGVSNASRDEQPWSKGGSDRIAFDPNGIDSEGLAYDRRDGSYWICEEYGPSILHVAADGTILLRLVPQDLPSNAPGENVRDILPADLAKRKVNRGFEGIALSPDNQTLFAGMQSPLSNPDKATGEASRNLRIITLDVSKAKEPQLTGMYLYLAEPASNGSVQDDIKLGDMAAVSSTRVLVAERDNLDGGSHKMVYAVDLGDATNLLNRDSGKKTLEQMTSADLRGARIKPLAKTAVADLADLGYSPEKLEGIAIVDDRTIAAVNDNDFGFAGFDDSGQAITSGVDTHLVLVRLDRPIR